MQASDQSLLDDYALLQEVAFEAGELAKSFFQKSDISVWEKTPNHPVSEADLSVNQLIEKRLMTARPDYGWLSEESVRPSQRPNAKRTWIVDPIDGTRAFIKGEPYWCIGLGLLEAGRATIGVVHAPILQQTYQAMTGQNAHLNQCEIRASQRSDLPGTRMIGSAQMFRRKDWPEPWPDMEFVTPKPNATLLRMCHVASGQSDATLALGRKSDWDLAPAAIIASEAGAIASTHLGEPFLFNRGEPAQRSLLVSGKPLHSLLRDRVKHIRLPDPNWAVQPDRKTPDPEE